MLALGGGAVLDPSDPRRCWPASAVVFLDVGLAEAARRVGLGAARPLLLGNVRAQLKALLDERAGRCTRGRHVVVDTDGRTPEEVADEVAGGWAATAMTARAAPGSGSAAAAPYDVVVGHDLLGELPGLLGRGVQRVAVVHPRAAAPRPGTRSATT